MSEDPKARVLHVLLVWILLWMVVCGLVVVPLFVARKAASLALVGELALTAVSSLYLLRRGSLVQSAVVYIAGTWIFSSVLIMLSGGIRSPFLVMYAALPMSAAWLVGYRAAILTAAASMACALALGILESAGLGPYFYFPGRPLATLAVVWTAILIAVLPVSAVMKMLQDALTQSRLAQEALRKERDMMSRLMETSPAGILALDREGEIRFANARGAALLGTTPDEICRSSYNSANWRISDHDGRPLPPQMLPFRQVQARGEVIYGMEMAVQPGHRQILLSVNAAPLADAAGEFDGMIATIDDVSERKTVERDLYQLQANLAELVKLRTTELAHALDQAQAAGRSKTAFLANMSHELRTPLNAILGFSTLLRAGKGVSASQAEALDIITRSGHYLLSLIDDILDIARLDAGRGALVIDVADLDALVRDVLTLMRVSAEEKNLELSFQWIGTPIRLARLDAPKLRQILVNLIGNAVKYTDQGSIVVRVFSGSPDSGGQERVRIEVQDTGIGIAPGEQALLFEPFVQLGQPNSRKGSGLGLAICRQYAQLMQGSIQVESTLGAGSTFRLELPVEVVEFQSGNAVETIPAEVGGPAPHGLAGIAALPEELKAQLLEAVLLLDKERIIEVTRLVSLVAPALADNLARRANAFEFTPIMRAIQSVEVP